MRLFILSSILVLAQPSTTSSAYTVAILNKGKLICNGAIIHNEFIVTSASCVNNGTKPSELIIRAGSENYNSGGVTAEVSKIITHKKYNESTLDYDIAVLWLKGCLAISTTNIAEIATAQKHISAREGLLTGWVLNEISAGRLQFHLVNLHRRSKCAQVAVESITKRMLCGGITINQRCIDFPSGSPLAADGKLIGIKTFGFPCAQNQPNIFTDISVVYKFIQKTVKRFS